MPPIIECQHIEVRVNPGAEQASRLLLQIPHWELRSGEQAAVMGPSGSGKSTLLHLLSGLLLPTAGRFTLFGRDAAALGEAERDQLRGTRIGLVFQQFHLFPALTAYENVLMQHLVHPTLSAGAAQSRALRLLEAMQLSHRQHQRLSRLSRGEQQRVAIARSLFHDPELVLADEPTGNLDAETAQDVIGYLQDLCRESRRTLLVVTHDESVAARFPRVERMDKLNRAYAHMNHRPTEALAR